jgi:hypothetical protein
MMYLTQLDDYDVISALIRWLGSWSCCVVSVLICWLAWLTRWMSGQRIKFWLIAPSPTEGNIQCYSLMLTSWVYEDKPYVIAQHLELQTVHFFCLFESSLSRVPRDRLIYKQYIVQLHVTKSESTMFFFEMRYPQPLHQLYTREPTMWSHRTKSQLQI